MNTYTTEYQWILHSKCYKHVNNLSYSWKLQKCRYENLPKSLSSHKNYMPRLHIIRTFTIIVLNLIKEFISIIFSNVIRELIPNRIFCQIIHTKQYLILLYNSFQIVRMLSENSFQIKQYLILPKK